MSLKDKASKVDLSLAGKTLTPRSGNSKTVIGMHSDALFRDEKITLENTELKQKLAKFDGAIETRKIDSQLIRSSKWANRSELSYVGEEFASLKMEIEESGGNVQPIKVRPLVNAPGEYELVFGHRRHRACLELGIEVLAIIEEIGDEALFVQMDRENRSRADLRPFEQGVMYARALDDGLFSSQRKLAEALGVDQSNASKVITIARLPKEVLGAFGSVLEIQQGWSTPLTSALKVDPDGVLKRAKLLLNMNPRLTAASVYKELLGGGEVSNLTSDFQPVIMRGNGGKTGKIGFNAKKNTFEISLAGLGQDRIKEIEAVLKPLLS
jgi:ParB family chromosome partitioning protein